MQLLKEYFRLQQAIYDYFEYVEDWVVIPIEDSTDQYWWLDCDEGQRGHVHFSPEPFTVESILEGDTLYSNEVYRQRFLPRWVYRAEDYTMICVDTHTDGNKFLQVFDNTKELRNPPINLKRAFAKWEYPY